MAWHTVQDTLKLTGKSRSQLYRDMAKGLVSYRTGKDDRREFETSELIRAYGELNTSETPQRHRKGQSKKGDMPAENPQLAAIQKQLNDLQQTVTLMIEDKTAREIERQKNDADRQRMQEEINSLNDALEQEKKRSIWSKLLKKS